MVATIEAKPETLLSQKQITLHDLIVFELILKLTSLKNELGPNWLSLSTMVPNIQPINLLDDVPQTELQDVLTIFRRLLNGVIMMKYWPAFSN